MLGCLRYLQTKLLSIYSHRTQRPATSYQLRDTLYPNGKIRTDRIKQVAKTLSEDAFGEFLPFSCLIGSGIYCEQDSPRELKQAPISTTATRLFFAKQIQQLIDRDAIQSAMFVLRKELEHRNFSPEYTELLVGRAQACDIRLIDPTISRHHAKLTLTPQGIEITDSGAKNSIRINGQLLRGSQVLTPNDTLQFGRFEFRIVDPKTLHALLNQF
jgi:hypothetical protein